VCPHLLDVAALVVRDRSGEGLEEHAAERGLDVAVDEPVAVRLVERPGDLGDDPQRAGRLEAAVLARKPALAPDPATA
jgi:hypothetical protein